MIYQNLSYLLNHLPFATIARTKMHVKTLNKNKKRNIEKKRRHQTASDPAFDSAHEVGAERV